jgi:hypothetical protein
MTTQEILTAVATGQIKPEEAAKLIGNGKTGGTLSCKVSEKGAVSVYGLQRMPVTLYGAQWERLLGFADEIKKFIAANKSKLSTK